MENKDNQDLKKKIVQADESDEEPENLQFKVVVVGNGTVGKTSIIMRFCEDYFAKSYKQTIGVDFFVKRIEMQQNINVALQVWDIGGQSIFSKMIQTYIYEANAVVLVYDITNQQSFQDLEDWLNLVNKAFEGKEKPIMTLIGNKFDLNHMQAVKNDQHDKFIKENNIKHQFYVSAKRGDNINACFYQIASDLSGIQVAEPLIENTQQPVVAEIVQHKQNDETKEKAEQVLEKAKKKESKCTIF